MQVLASSVCQEIDELISSSQNNLKDDMPNCMTNFRTPHTQSLEPTVNCCPSHYLNLGRWTLARAWDTEPQTWVSLPTTQKTS